MVSSFRDSCTCDTTPLPSSDAIKTHKEAIDYLNKIKYNNLPAITDKQVTKILKLLISEKLTYLKWNNYLKNVEKLEKCFRKSETFTLEKATEIFHSHLEPFNKEEFDVNQKLPGIDLTPVGFAAQNKSPALLNALIQAKADVNCGSKNSQDLQIQSPLHLVFQDSPTHVQARLEMNYSYYTFPDLQTECINVLIQHGCDPNSREIGDKSEVIFFNIPLTCAIEHGNTDQVESLVKAKADINIKINRGPFTTSYTTPLHMAISQISTLRKLVEFGADFFEMSSRHLETAAGEAKRLTNGNESFQFLSEIMAKRLDDTRVTLLELRFPKVLIDIVLDYLRFPRTK